MEGYGPETYGDRFADVYDRWFTDVSDAEGTVRHVLGLLGATDQGDAVDGDVMGGGAVDGGTGHGGDAGRGSGNEGGAGHGRGPGAVLELGAGSGRLALPLAAAGVETWAVDASAAMVERLRAKPGSERVHAVVEDMSVLDLPGAPPFAVVLCAFNTFFNLTGIDAQRRCLRAVADKLAPGGHLLIEGFVPEPGGEETAARSAVEPRHIGLDEVVLTVSRYDRASRTVTGQHVQLTEAGVRLRPWVLRLTPPDELDALAGEAGLVLDARYGGWRGEPFTPASALHVSSYRRY